MTLLVAPGWQDAPASPGAIPVMDGDDSDHERLYEDVRLPGSASKRKDRSAVGQTWRSLNEKATPNQARVHLGSSPVVATWRSVNVRATRWYHYRCGCSSRSRQNPPWLLTGTCRHGSWLRPMSDLVGTAVDHCSPGHHAALWGGNRVPRDHGSCAASGRRPGPARNPGRCPGWDGQGCFADRQVRIGCRISGCGAA